MNSTRPFSSEFLLIDELENSVHDELACHSSVGVNILGYTEAEPSFSVELKEVGGRVSGSLLSVTNDHSYLRELRYHLSYSITKTPKMELKTHTFPESQF